MAQLADARRAMSDFVGTTFDLQRRRVERRAKVNRPTTAVSTGRHNTYRVKAGALQRLTDSLRARCTSLTKWLEVKCKHGGQFVVIILYF